MERRIGRQDDLTFIVRHTPGVLHYSGAFDQCCTDCELIRRSKDGTEDVLKLRASRGGKGRYDLRCPSIPGWPKDTYWMRIMGWCFLNSRKLGWHEFNAKIPIANGHFRHKWQVNHESGSPERCVLEDMSLIRDEDNMDHYAVHAPEFHGKVFKRPAKRGR